MFGEGNVSPYTQIKGWVSTEESHALRALISTYLGQSEVNAVNVGCEYGRSVSEFVDAGQQVHVLAVDLFPEDHHLVGDLLRAFQGNTKQWADQITVLQGNSQTVKPANGKRKYDLIFIDAGHTYEDVKGDIANWAGRVRSGGVLVFHDYAQNEYAHPLHFEVKRAVDEWHSQHLSEWKRAEGPDSLVWFFRS